MNYYFSEGSLRIIRTCVPPIRVIAFELIKIWDCKAIWGRRNEKEQNLAFMVGASTKQWPNSKHNAIPPKLSKALDIIPFPIDWEDEARFRYQNGLIRAIAHSKGIKIRGGWDWNGDNNFKDQRLNDLAHIETID